MVPCNCGCHKSGFFVFLGAPGRALWILDLTKVTQPTVSFPPCLEVVYAPRRLGPDVYWQDWAALA